MQDSYQDDEFNTYSSYFVRLWCESGAGRSGETDHWRGEIESVQTGESWQFAKLEALLEILASNGTGESTSLGRYPSGEGGAL